MATVSELVRDVLASAATDAGGIACAKWVDNRYKEMLATVKFRSHRVIGELSLPAVVPTSSEGSTVDATRGSTGITGTDSTWATSPTTSPGDDWYFRARSAWYRIASVTSNTVLTLDSAFAEDDVDDGSYSIVKRYHSLASDARRLGTFVHSRLRTDLESISLDELNIIAPGRILVGSIPRYVAEVGTDSDGYKSVEIYPPPTKTELLYYVYWKQPTSLTVNGDIPQYIDPYVLKEGTLVDLYRFEKAASLRKGNVEAAATWANEEHKQRTRWRGMLKDARKADRGVDDVTLILDMMVNSRRGRWPDITTAREDVLATWSV